MLIKPLRHAKDSELWGVNFSASSCLLLIAVVTLHRGLQPPTASSINVFAKPKSA